MVFNGIWYQVPWSRAVQYWGIEGPILPIVKKQYQLKKMISVKMGKSTKNGIDMLLLLCEKNGNGIGMLFTLQN